tara:strand:+ start:2585 stop:3520 length:936 start_codon:yes stop_codon:yes gene_type:complete
MNEIITINTENYASMAKAMGLPTPSLGEKKTNILNRFRVWHQPTMGKDINSKGKEITTEVVDGGMYRLEVVGDRPAFYFAEKVKFRPFLQRFMYKKYTQFNNVKPGEKKGDYCKTIMADNLNMDLKDTSGTFNCGKPAGYVEDFHALPEATKILIKSIKRNRVVFGVVELINPVKGIDGKEVEDLSTFPVIWEIDNNDAFKALGEVYTKLARMERLPLQHNIELNGTNSHSTNTGSNYYTPIVNLDLTTKLDITEEDHKLFGNFMDWIKSNNDYTITKWEEAVAKKQDTISDEDRDTVNDFIDVEVDNENV